MDFINVSIVPVKDAFDELSLIIKKAFNRETLDIETESTLVQLLEEFSANSLLYIEYPYVDKVYRDSYYHYFASKHREYPRDCIRISVFDNTLKPKHFKDGKSKDKLQTAFLGYIVLRPTFPSIIGRTLLNRRALTNHNFITCQCKGSVLVNGVKLVVDGFPFSSQDTETITCAETTIWAVMEYFGNRYPDYRPVLPSTILKVLNSYSNQRMLPSNGLTAEQISYALKEFGFGTYIYSRNAHPNLENIISTYVESGIPIIATLENDKIGHAVLVIGHENDNQSISSQIRHELPHAKGSVPFVDYTDLPKKYVVQDDNLTPYKLIDLNNPAEHYKGIDDNFAGSIIAAIVVPLYSKIYLEAITARALALKIAADADYGYYFQKDFVFRFFLTSSRSFKSHIAGLANLDPTVQQTLINTRMPKFIWCAEFYENGGFMGTQAAAIIVLDATEASANEHETLIFAGYPDRCFVKASKKIVTLQFKLHLYTEFKNNLL